MSITNAVELGLDMSSSDQLEWSTRSTQTSYYHSLNIFANDLTQNLARYQQPFTVVLEPRQLVNASLGGDRVSPLLSNLFKVGTTSPPFYQPII